MPRLPAGPHKFDIVFVDPPYKFFDQANIRKQLLGLLDELAMRWFGKVSLSEGND